jgi:hypothetical protein
MNRKPNPADEFPPGLDGGEPPSHSDHRIGERERQNPQRDLIDPAGIEPSGADNADDEADDADEKA